MANVFAFALVGFAVVVLVYTFFVHLTSSALAFHTSFKLRTAFRFVRLLRSVFRVLVRHGLTSYRYVGTPVPRTKRGKALLALRSKYLPQTLSLA